MDRRSPQLLLVASALPVAALLALVVLAQRNSLERYESWQAMKWGLERGVMGAVHFVEGRQALAGDRLDLGVWHGFQGLRLRDPEPLREIRFELELDEGAWLALLWHSGARGLRLSRHPLFPAARLWLTAEGGFSRRQPVELPAAVVEALGRGPLGVRVRFDHDATRLWLGGQELTWVEEAVGAPQWIGFRGGRESARVDDVVLELRSGALLREDFDGRDGAMALLAGAWLLIAVVQLAASRRRGWPGTGVPPEFPWVVANVVLALILAAVFAVDRYVLAPRYEPLVDLESLFERERSWVRDETDAISRELSARYAEPPGPGVLRVMAIGSSQTWGAGARRRDQTFVRRLESALGRKPGRGRPVEIMNAGVSGQEARGLLERFASEWIELGPEVLLVNLSNNDEDLESFESGLRGFARLCRERGIHAIFVHEPNALDRPPELLPRHAVMERVAGSEGIPLVRLHDRLAARADSGFLWWDHVHPTSYGHRLIAEILVEDIDWEELRASGHDVLPARPGAARASPQTRRK